MEVFSLACCPDGKQVGRQAASQAAIRASRLEGRKAVLQLQITTLPEREHLDHALRSLRVVRRGVVRRLPPGSVKVE